MRFSRASSTASRPAPPLPAGGRTADIGKGWECGAARFGGIFRPMAWNLLLVEPDAGFADEIRGAFEPAGFSVQVVATGEEAVERCRLGPFSLVILGAELPDMSGFSVCNRLKRGLPHVPLILYTSEATEQAVEAHRATRTKADEYLRRPFELPDLLGKAAALLQNAPPAPAHPAMAPAQRPPPPRPPTGERLPAQGGGPPPPPRPPGPPVIPAGQSGPPPMPPRPQGGPPPVPRAAPPSARQRVQIPGGDPSEVLNEWPRDPAPPKGTPEEKLEFFRERLRARDTFLAKVRDAFGAARAQSSAMTAEIEGLGHELQQAQVRIAQLESQLDESIQGGQRRDEKIAALEGQLAQSESTRQSLSDVLNETMQQQEAAEANWAQRIAQSEEQRPRLRGARGGSGGRSRPVRGGAGRAGVRAPVADRRAGGAAGRRAERGGHRAGGARGADEDPHLRARRSDRTRQGARG